MDVYYVHVKMISSLHWFHNDISSGDSHMTQDKKQQENQRKQQESYQRNDKNTRRWYM